jgi:hypothetical protein
MEGNIIVEYAKLSGSLIVLIGAIRRLVEAIEAK